MSDQIVTASISETGPQEIKVDATPSPDGRQPTEQQHGLVSQESYEETINVHKD